MSLCFKIRFIAPDDRDELGWVGINSKGWCVPSDETNAVEFEKYIHSDKKTYYKAISGKYKDYYLSQNRNAYIGLYSWNSAVSWKFTGKHLISGYNNQKLSLYSTGNNYLYAWDDYKILEVEFVKVEFMNPILTKFASNGLTTELLIKEPSNESNPKIKVLILGSSGVGKTQLIKSIKNILPDVISNEKRTTQKAIYNLDINEESFSFIDVPGGEQFLDDRKKAIENYIKDVSIIINVVCYGYHEYHRTDNLEPIIDGEISKDYLEKNRQREIEALSEEMKTLIDLLESKELLNTDKRLLTVVNKADLWEEETEIVLQHYISGDYFKALPENVASNLKHNVIPYCSVDNNFYNKTSTYITKEIKEGLRYNLFFNLHHDFNSSCITEKITALVIEAFEKLTPDIQGIYNDASSYTVLNWTIDNQIAVTAAGSIAMAIPGVHALTLPADIVYLMNRMAVCSYGIGAIYANIKSEEKAEEQLRKDDFKNVLIHWIGDKDLIKKIGGAAPDAASGTTKSMAIGLASTSIPVSDIFEIINKEIPSLKAGNHDKIQQEVIKTIKDKAFYVTNTAPVAGDKNVRQELTAKTVDANAATQAVSRAAAIMAGKKISAKLGAKIGAKFTGKIAAKIGSGSVGLGAILGGAINLWFITGIAQAANDYYSNKFKAEATGTADENQAFTFHEVEPKYYFAMIHGLLVPDSSIELCNKDIKEATHGYISNIELKEDLNGYYRYEIIVTGSGGKIENTDMTFVDEDDDEYELSLRLPRTTKHSLKYNSKRPNIKKIIIEMKVSSIFKAPVTYVKITNPAYYLTTL